MLTHLDMDKRMVMMSKGEREEREGEKFCHTSTLPQYIVG